jgi:hypothetical protein
MRAKRRGNALIVYLVMLASMAIVAGTANDIGKYVNQKRIERAEKFIEEVGIYVSQLHLKGVSIMEAGADTTAVYDLLNVAGFPGSCPPQSELVRIANIVKLDLGSRHSDHAYIELIVRAKKVLFPSVMRNSPQKLNSADGAVVAMWDPAKPEELYILIHFIRGMQRR